MPSGSGYRFVLGADVYHFGETQRSAERKKLGEAFRFLTDHPFLTGDYQETDQDGRTVEVLLRGRFVLVFWTDHAAKEVRIVRVTRS